MSRIEHAELYLVDLPPPVVRTDAIQSFVTQETPILTLTDADGAHGTGYTYTIGTGGSSVVALLRDHLLPRLIGQEAERIEAIWHDLLFSTHATAMGAITSLALAAVDTALWDLRARRAGLPLHVLAGGAHDRLPVYTTEGGWLHLPIEALVEDTLAMQAHGFGGAKIKVGQPRRAEDARRLAAVRAAVGDDFELMTDANQSLRLDAASRLAHDLDALNVAWLEEPLPADDVEGHVRLQATSPLPIAVGESMYSLSAFKDYLTRDGCRVVQADVARVGGITPWLKIAHLAEAHNVAVCPHFLMELHVSLACAVQNGTWVEYIPQLDTIITSRLDLRGGMAHAPTSPGLGIDWDWDAVRARNRLDRLEVRA